MNYFKILSLIFMIGLNTLEAQTYQQIFNIQDSYDEWSIELDPFTNHYYMASTVDISGSNKIVVLKVDASGNQVWTKFYDTPATSSFKFGGIQMSNSRPDLVITGAVYDQSNNLWNGLEMVINGSGGVMLAREYSVDSRNVVFLDGALNDFYSEKDEYYIGGYITDGNSDALTTAKRKSLYIRHDDNLNYFCKMEYFYDNNYGARNAINRISIQNGALAVSGLSDNKSLIDCTDLSDLCLSPTRITFGTGGDFTITDNFIESSSGEYYFSGFEAPAHGQVIFSMDDEYNCNVTKLNNINKSSLTSRAFSMDKSGENFYLAGYVSFPSNNTFVTKYDGALNPLYNKALSNNYSYGTTPFFSKLSFPDNLTTDNNGGYTLISNRDAAQGIFDLIHVELDNYDSTCDNTPLPTTSHEPKINCDPMKESTLPGAFATITIEDNNYSLSNFTCSAYYRKGNDDNNLGALEGEQELENAYFEVYDFAGKLIKKGTFENKNDLISSLEKGIYLIRSSNGVEKLSIHK